MIARRLLPPLVVGVLIRAAMWISPKSFWGDEWFSIQTAQAPSLAETVRLSVADVHPPLYYVFLRWASQVGGGPELALRFVSFAAGLAMFGTLAWIAHRFLNRFAASACVWLIALSPYWLQSANEVRSYALMAFCVTAAAAGFLTMTETVSDNRSGTRALPAAVYLFFSAASVYVEHYSWFWVLASCAYLAVRAAGPAPARISGGLRTAAAVLVLGLPSLVLIGYQAQGGEQMFVAARLLEYWNPAWMIKKIAGVFWHFSAGYEFAMLTVERVSRYASTSPYFWACGAAVLVSVPAFVWGAADWRRSRPALFWVILFGFAAPLIFLWICYPIRLHARYLSFAAPWFFLAVGAGLGRLPAPAGRVLLAALLAVGAFGSWKSVASATDRVHRQDHRGQTRYILEHAAPDDLIVGNDPAFSYYQNKLGIPLRSSRCAGFGDLNPDRVRGIRRIWMPDITNMHPEVNDRNLRRIEERMAKLGYRRTAPPIYFGGEGAMTLLYAFDRDLA